MYIHITLFKFMSIAVCDCVRSAVCSILIHAVCGSAAVCGRARRYVPSDYHMLVIIDNYIPTIRTLGYCLKSTKAPGILQDVE
jgi:hypothetical protein